MIKRSKRFLPILLALMLFTNGLCVNASNEVSWLSEDVRQGQIEQIFEELNSLAAVEANQKYLDSNGLGNFKTSVDSRSDRDVKLANERQNELEAIQLEQKLAELGVNKIDASDSEDMKMLKEMEATLEYSENVSERSGIYDTAPNLSAIANLYTLYTYDGKVNRNGTEYYYRYIKVIDNKGYNGLTHIQELNAIASLPSSQLTNILNYNFNYVFTSLLGKVPGGILVNWTLGNIFTIFNNMSSAQISSSGSAIYRIFHTGVTSMTYYYVYNNGWKMVGVGASASIIRDDYFAGNVNGTPRTDYNSVSFSTSTSGIWSDYVNAYINNMSVNPNFCITNELGSFDVNGYSNSLTYTPAYARVPADLY